MPRTNGKSMGSQKDSKRMGKKDVKWIAEGIFYDSDPVKRLFIRKTFFYWKLSKKLVKIFHDRDNLVIHPLHPFLLISFHDPFAIFLISFCDPIAILLLSFSFSFAIKLSVSNPFAILPLSFCNPIFLPSVLGFLLCTFYCWNKFHYASYEWLNKTISKIWQSYQLAADDIIVNVLWPNLRQVLPDLPINLSLDLYYLTLGRYSLLLSFLWVCYALKSL